MKVRRFVGATSRSVLKQVRTELGPDAVILANKPVAEGIEILAASQLDMAGLIATPHMASSRIEKKQPVQPAPRPPVSVRSYFEHIKAAEEYAGIAAETTPAPVVAKAAVPRIAEAAAPLALEKPAAQPEQAVRSAQGAEAGNVLAEIKHMKGMLSEQLTALAWGESVRRRPLRGVMLRELVGAGFGLALSRTITEKLPDDFNAAQSRRWLHAVLARNLLPASGAGIVERGGVFALVGPTGVGKTTTAAKIAAQCVVRHGVKSLGLITTDSYRVGAHDQLRIYGKILGVPVFVAQDAMELEHAIAAVADKHLVLIDTIGMGQRDSRMAEQRALLSAPGIERLLLLNATAQTETLEDVVRAYAKGNIHGAIITKMDEAVRLGGVLDVAIRRKLPLHFVTNGQRVPEDIHIPNLQLLVHQALKDSSADGDDAGMVGLSMDSEPAGIKSKQAGAHA